MGMRDKQKKERQRRFWSRKIQTAVAVLFFLCLTACGSSADVNVESTEMVSSIFSEVMTSVEEDITEVFSEVVESSVEEIITFVETEETSTEIVTETFTTEDVVAESSSSVEEKIVVAEPVEEVAPVAETPVEETPVVEEPPVIEEPPVVETPPADGGMVWKSETGKKYHSINNCGRMNPDKATQISRAEAEALGLGPCSKCW